MKHRHLPFRIMQFCALVTLVGCSSSDKNKEPEGATVSGLNRFMDKGFDRKSGQFDRNMVSQFDQSKYSTNKKVKENEFRTDSFAGKHDYTGSSDYKATKFSQSDKVSRESKEAFSGASKESREASQEYVTKDSRYGSQEARQGDQRFGGDEKAFKTREVRDAAKSQKENVRPEIIPKDGDDGEKSAYSEAEVKRLVNRN